MISEDISERLSIASFLLTLVIVFSHATYSGHTRWMLSLFDSSSALNGFFFISGYLMCRKPLLVWANYRHVLSSRTRSLLFPYAIWSGAAMICFLLPYDIWTTWMRHWTETLGSPPRIGNFYYFWLLHSTAYPLWYLRTLFLFAIASPAIYLALQRLNVLPILFVLAFQSLQTQLPVSVHGQHLEAVVWFMLGGVLSIKKISLGGAIPCPLGLLALSVLCSMTNTHWYLSSACGLLGVWGLTRYCRPLARRLGWLVIPYAFFIYLFHEPFMDVLSVCLVRVTRDVPGGDYLVALFGPVLTISIAIILATLLQRHVPRVYGLLTGGRLRGFVRESRGRVDGPIAAPEL
jgi:hypothetical protein